MAHTRLQRTNPEACSGNACLWQRRPKAMTEQAIQQQQRALGGIGYCVAPTHLSLLRRHAAPSQCAAPTQVVINSSPPRIDTFRRLMWAALGRLPTSRPYSGTPHHQPCIPNAMNSRPPSRDTVRSLMWAAIWRPPSTAAPVQIAWPRMPPSVTPYTSVDAARPIVAICAAHSQLALSALHVRRLQDE